MVVGGFIFLWISTFDIPDLTTFEERKVVQSTKIYDKTGEILLYEFNNNDIKRTIISSENISRHIKNATIAIEDAEFYNHNGVRPVATFRAVFIQPLRGKGVQGGSTITQQVIKNSLLTSEKKISRKMKEWVLAIRLEQLLSKEDILELYLNESPYGGALYGVGEAVRVFFDKDPFEVTLAEAAYLAALPQAPTYFSPYGNNREALDVRKNLVLIKMLENNFITQEEYEGAINEVVEFAPRATLGVRAPHFVFAVGEYLEQKYGARILEEGGLRVTTTLDYTLQEKAEEIVKKHALKNSEAFNAENASLVAVDPKTGGVLVMVGSRDYFDEEIDGNFNVTLSHRQPGSAFKPFVYATAFAKGYTPETVVFDVQTQFSTQCDYRGNPLSVNAVCYTPQNYDEVFRGPVSLREALAQSMNIPAIKTLYLAGIYESLRTARDMGITSLTNIDQYGLTLVLGGGEVSPLEMASAYSVFANDGVRNPYVFILKIEDSNGNILEEYRPSPKQAISKNVARQISDILSDNIARTPAFGANSPLYFNSHDVAAKTGTTNDYRDAWTVGYTPTISVAAWAGNNDNSSMEKKVAGFIITPLWREFMDEALRVLPSENFKSPDSVLNDDLPPPLRGVWQGGISYYIDTISGKRATELTPEETKKEIILTDVHSILYWIDKDDPTSKKEFDREDQSQFHLWEPPVREWADKNGFTTQNPQSIPTEYDDIHVEKNKPSIQITGLKNSYNEGEMVSFSITTSGVYPISSVEIFFAGRFIDTKESGSFSFSFNPRDYTTLEKGELIIKAVDSVYNTSSLFKTLSL